MRRTVLLTALLLLAPAAASAEPTFVVSGGGWGHGVGLMQWGARGLAEHGKDYRQILHHYYRRTNLSETDDVDVRVLLQAGSSPGVAFDGAGWIGEEPLDPGRAYELRARGADQLELRSGNGELVKRFSGAVSVDAGGPIRLLGTAINGVTDGRYRGEIEFRREASGGVTAVNVVGLEQYLQGVVPKEMPASWHPQALKAQAVAARSYALATGAGGTELYPDVRSQVYGGFDGELETSNEAVQSTAGEVLRHRGEIVVAYFSSSSGGHTESVENSLSDEPAPYLVGVEDPYDDISPHHRWERVFTRGALEAELGGLVAGHLRRLEVERRGASPRIVEARVIGTGGDVKVSGATLKARLGLPEVATSFERRSDGGGRGRSGGKRRAGGGQGWGR